jgi:hypothetical protein
MTAEEFDFAAAGSVSHADRSPAPSIIAQAVGRIAFSL